ncbi:MAG TPA: hypothetical protein VKB17_03885 [Thermoleophilaceae bacterium]|nr:hypothetical protein [Thermoleophilaceae bacterium]
MTPRRWITLILVAAVVDAATVAAASSPTIRVSPNRAYRGEVVRVFGSVAGGCAVGGQVTLTSRAFSRVHEFAGVPAIFARVRSNGSFSKRTRIPRRRKPGRYSIRGRCGGGNLGVSARLRILVARHCGNYTYDGPGPADERSFIAIRTRRVTCGAAKLLMRQVAAAGDACPAHWRCVYPLTGRATWTRGRKRITFVPAG